MYRMSCFRPLLVERRYLRAVLNDEHLQNLGLVSTLSTPLRLCLRSTRLERSVLVLEQLTGLLLSSREHHVLNSEATSIECKVDQSRQRSRCLCFTAIFESCFAPLSDIHHVKNGGSLCQPDGTSVRRYVTGEILLVSHQISTKQGHYIKRPFFKINHRP